MKLPQPDVQRSNPPIYFNRSTTANTEILKGVVATGATTSTITVAGAAWGVNAFAGRYVFITGGTGALSAPRIIASNTATTITITGTFAVTPAAGSVFSVGAFLYPGLQGTKVPNSTGGHIIGANTYRELLKVGGHSSATVRILTITSTGTLTLTPCRTLANPDPNDQGIYQPDGAVDTTKVYKYTTGVVSASVAAATELKLTIPLSGEAYVLVEYAPSLAGTLVYCDAMMLRCTPSGSSADAAAMLALLQEIADNTAP